MKMTLFRAAGFILYAFCIAQTGYASKESFLEDLAKSDAASLHHLSVTAAKEQNLVYDKADSPRVIRKTEISFDAAAFAYHSILEKLPDLDYRDRNVLKSLQAPRVGVIMVRPGGPISDEMKTYSFLTEDWAASGGQVDGCAVVFSAYRMDTGIPIQVNQHRRSVPFGRNDRICNRWIREERWGLGRGLSGFLTSINHYKEDDAEIQVNASGRKNMPGEKPYGTWDLVFDKRAQNMIRSAKFTVQGEGEPMLWFSTQGTVTLDGRCYPQSAELWDEGHLTSITYSNYRSEVNKELMEEANAKVTPPYPGAGSLVPHSLQNQGVTTRVKYQY